MAAIKKIEREYNMDDLDMLELAQVFHGNFLIDKTAFTAAFPILADPFAADFQTAIDAADDVPSGAEVDSLIAIVTEELNAKLPLARAALQKLFTYADLTWNSSAKTNSFGKNRYEKARQSQVKLKELLELAHRQADSVANKADLITAGYLQVDIDELETLMEAIDTLNAQQELELSNRGIQTEARVTAMNAVWEFMRQINKTSKVVFVNSPAKLDLYLLYPTSSTSLPKVQNLEATVEAGPPVMASLSWDSVGGSAEYQVFMSQVAVGQPAGTYDWVAGTILTSFDQPIFAGFRFWFKVRAIDEPTTGAYSDAVFVEP